MIEPTIEDMGFEVVRVRVSGTVRPVLEVMAEPADGSPMTVEGCASISRAISAVMDVEDPITSAYTLEVSSPGVDRPLLRPRDFERFKGEYVAVKGKDVLLDKATRIEGELLGLAKSGTDEESVLLRLPSGEEVSIPRSEIRKAHLVFTWK